MYVLPIELFGRCLFALETMAAQLAGLKTQECQRNLSTIYIGRNQNNIA